MNELRDDQIAELQAQIAQLKTENERWLQVHLVDSAQIAKLESDRGIDEMLVALGKLMHKYHEVTAENEHLKREIQRWLREIERLQQ